VIAFADFLGFPLVPDQASDSARKIDNLFLFILIVTGGMGLLVGFLLVVFGIRYRRRSERDVTPRITGFPLLEWSWTLAPFGVFAIMFGWGLYAFRDNYRPPPDAYEVFVVGKQWMWKVQHPGGRREINELHIAVNRPVKVTFISEDVIHDFAVPAFRSKIDVLPGRYVSTWYLPTRTGRFHLFCDQFCGTSHARMVGSVVVMSPEELEAWSQDKAEGAPALEGRKLFLKFQCVACHSADERAKAPVLEGLFGRKVALKRGGSTVADFRYLRDSILTPSKEVVEGWEPLMPSFQGQVSEDELFQLLAFLRALGPGQTPHRNNADPAPLGAPSSAAEKKP
jgi:cytochrome c oxidase subunit 2